MTRGQSSLFSLPLIARRRFLVGRLVAERVSFF